jgi:hypothetical protein
MNKSNWQKPTAKPLGDILSKTCDDMFARQGFASRELVTRWASIVGENIAAHCEPVKIQWPRVPEKAPDQAQEPATLVLRVEGPLALEIQHQSDAIIARVNRFLGWAAIGRLALKQAPLSRPEPVKALKVIPQAQIEAVAGTLEAIEDEELRQALARLGAALKQS